MSDEKKNIENNQEENQNRQECNKKWWKKLLELKQNYIEKIVLLIFILCILTCGCKMQTKVNSNAEHKNKESAITIENINTKEMKISTPEECRQKGLHYIGKMTRPRVSHTVVKLNNGEVLITGGIDDNTAEIFNPLTNKFNKLASKPKYSRHLNSIILDQNNILLSGENLEIYNIKNKKFKVPFNNIDFEKKMVQFSENIDNHLLQCVPSLTEETICSIRNLKNFRKKTIKYKFERPKNYYEGGNLGLLYIGKDKILCYEKLFNEMTGVNKRKDLFISVYNIPQNKFMNSNIIEKIGRIYEISSPILIDNDNILFISGIEKIIQKPIDEYIPFHDNNIKLRYTKSHIYNISKNKVIKKIDLLYSNVLFPIRAIKLSNGNILIIEKTAIRQFFNIKNKEYEKIQNECELNSIHFNLFNLNDNQILITGGITTNTNEKVSSAWIYTY